MRLNQWVAVYGLLGYGSKRKALGAAGFVFLSIGVTGTRLTHSHLALRTWSEKRFYWSFRWIWVILLRIFWDFGLPDVGLSAFLLGFLLANPRLPFDLIIQQVLKKSEHDRDLTCFDSLIIWPWKTPTCSNNKHGWWQSICWLSGKTVLKLLLQNRVFWAIHDQQDLSNIIYTSTFIWGATNTRFNSVDSQQPPQQDNYAHNKNQPQLQQKTKETKQDTAQRCHECKATESQEDKYLHPWRRKIQSTKANHQQNTSAPPKTWNHSVKPKYNKKQELNTHLASPSLIQSK